MPGARLSLLVNVTESTLQEFAITLCFTMKKQAYVDYDDHCTVVIVIEYA